MIDKFYGGLSVIFVIVRKLSIEEENVNDLIENNVVLLVVLI